MTPLLASLELFSAAGMKNLHSKGERLSGYLEYVVDEINKELAESLEIITPREKSQRGCQLSIVAHGRGKELFDKLTDRGVIADWREPNVIRMAPVPMYNSFEDIFDFGVILKESLK
jgi:kynureninase